ncbi:MAG: NUDIX hydrolase [Bacillota bacterium]
MKLLKEIYRQENLDFDGKIIYREAVRGVILKGDSIYMLFSNQDGDYKFPGGGIEAGETKEETLKREIKEETGALVLNIGEEIGKIIEYKEAKEEEYDIFKMISYYYMCDVKENYCNQCLDQYEKDLGFEPVWIDINDAIIKNKSIIDLRDQKENGWIIRETYVLEKIRKMLKKRQTI